MKPNDKMNSMTSQSRVSKITVGRLHNLGNYEHIRYEITVDVPEGQSAMLALSNIEKVLNGLSPKSPVHFSDVERAKSALAKPVEEWPEWERDNVDAYNAYIFNYNKWRADQKIARDILDDIGGTAVYTDAKDQWNEGDQ